jgi:hypothetical protein
MRLFKQVLLPIAVLLGVIALVTYVAHFRVTAPRGKQAALTPAHPVLSSH